MSPPAPARHLVPRPHTQLAPPLHLLNGMATLLVVVLFVLTFVVQSYQIPTDSMEDTLLVGDFLLVDKLIYSPPGRFGSLLPYRDPRDGDVIIFHHPTDAAVLLVKRVIGVSGDRLHMRDGVVFRNGVAQTEPYATHKRSLERDGYRDNFPAGAASDERVRTAWFSQLGRDTRTGDFIVPEGGFFVLGDNRDVSLDSRYWGLVPRQNIVGRPLFIYFSSATRPMGDDKIAHEREPYFARFTRIFRVVH